MKILEIGNVILPTIAKDINGEVTNFGGWLDSAIGVLSKEADMEIYYAFPYGEVVEGFVNNIRYRSFIRPDTIVVDENLVVFFEKMFCDIKPDIIHIWGTEFSHSLCAVRAAERAGIIKRVVASIQGLCSECAKSYCLGLPKKVIYKNTIRDIIRKDNIFHQQQKFYLRGNNEIEVLKKISNVIGRTDWDKKSCLAVNSDLEYHFCNESLRDIFYGTDKWSYAKCNQFTIFCSQASYPIKGFHIAVEALNVLVKKYPQAKVRVTGNSFVKLNVIERQKKTYYFTYLQKLVKKYKLENNITFLGGLSAKDMLREYLGCNVFLSPSNIENSSNSICEAQLLGAPVVASNVGGTDTIITDKVDGVLYDYDDIGSMVTAISNIFESEKYAEELGSQAQNTANYRHNRQKNNEDLINIYKAIAEKVSIE